jgi:acyl CoA:acetate/3-ketoacid CoA transferase beta subunit
MGVIPTIGARLAKATFEPDLLVTDGEALLVSNPLPLGHDTHRRIVEGWLPFHLVFDVVAAGRRHVMMGASQLDRFGNQNISCIGDWSRPKVQLLGARGAPGNTVNHPTSYWVPNHSSRVFVPKVDMVSGVGYDRAAEAGPEASRYHQIRRVVTNLGVFDFDTPDRTMRVLSLHPGVPIDDVRERTGFELSVTSEVGVTRMPTHEELELIRDVLDPEGHRHDEVPP